MTTADFGAVQTRKSLAKPHQNFQNKNETVRESPLRIFAALDAKAHIASLAPISAPPLERNFHQFLFFIRFQIHKNFLAT
ncbi:hypothetical protein LMA00_33165 [Burkholderia ambifaria]|uniref:hypothetical protein n=1 Tax=Burkholderia ambifaria TaxID=152480 RepID=UPI001E550F7D|nr:hypothetical protein [Burkholderia ambifaria]UEP52658.1 hypothetical protein LMA00_33165 [Burkholderia ambifaria]